MTKSPRKTPGATARTSNEQPAKAMANRVSVRVYRQGLGDCILVCVKRPDQDDFKLVIDCGLVLGAKNETPTSLREKTPAEIMTQIVENLVTDTKQKVDAIAVTHEHWDHLSGFGQARDSFAGLSVGRVWVAWTEDETNALANQLRTELAKARAALSACATALQASGDSATPDTLADIALTPFGAAAANSTTAIFEDVKKGAPFKDGKTAEPLLKCRPADSPIDIPGADARIYVLGPPEDAKLIRKINPSSRSPETYGLVLSGNGALPEGVVAALAQLDGGFGADIEGAIQAPEAAAPFHRRVTIPLADETGLDAFGSLDQKGAITAFFQKNYYQTKDSWRRIDADWLGSAPELALAIQSYTNNTSLVLALEIGPVGQGDVFLFAADAQVGNWESWQNLKWTIDGREVTGPELLARTIFYKVGHHGSHNATLRNHGLDQMIKLKVAIFPVDERQAKAKHWDKMPLPQLVEALEAKRANVLILRTDLTPSESPDFLKVDDLYFEISL